MSNKILVVGRTGQLAHELARGAWPSGLSVDLVERPEIDLARPGAARDLIIAMRPDIVVNAAAYTAVDAAEADSAMAYTVNRDGPAALADACRALGAPLIHISTDYVFDGSKTGAYVEDDPVCPLSVYGASKAAGEAAVRERLDRHVMIRTSWVYSAVGHNFVKTMLRLGAERDRLGIVEDQVGAPTAAAELARAAIAICATLAADHGNDTYGTFHFCGGGETSWYRFAREIFRLAAARGGKTPQLVEPIASEAYPTPAARPRNSRLDCGKIARTYGIVAAPWQHSLAACLDELAAEMPRPLVRGAA